MSAMEQEWAIVELMGYRKRAGLVCEVERFGVKLLRIDIPIEPDLLTSETFVSEFYVGSAIYAFRPCSEEVARAAADAIGDPRPVRPSSYRLTHDGDQQSSHEIGDDGA